MPAPAKNETEVTKWLNDNDGQAFVDTFYEAGFYYKKYISDGDIDKIVKKAKPGLAAVLKESLKEPTTKKPATMKLPDLPPRTPLDLSSQTLKLPDGKEFTLPTELSTQQSSTPIDSPEDLTQEDWMFLARKVKLLRGFLVDHDEPEMAPKPVLRWMLPDSDFFTDDTGHSGVDSSVSYTEATTKYVKAGFDTESASFAYTFCSASADREHKEKEARSSSTQNVHLVANYRYPRATVNLPDCTVVSPNFVGEVGKALESSDPEANLGQVFQKYGHVVPTTVRLGGKLRCEKTQTVTATEHLQEAETTLRAAVAIKAGAAEAAVSGSRQEATSQTDEAQSLAQHVEFEAIGGDTVLSGNPGAWAPTVHKARLWDVIGYGKMRSTVELLPEPLQARVKAVWYKRHPPVAFDEDEDHPWQAGRAVSVRPQGDGFVSVMRQAIADGDWGSASIVIGPGDNPREGNQATASGAAFIQKSEKFKVWYECNSICLPINAGSTCLARFNDVGGTPAGRLAFHATKLRFGDWVPAFGGSPAVAKEMPDTALSATAASDGFLFVTIRAAMFAQMGGVEGLIGEQAVASSFVHWAESSQPYPQQSFCIPVPARSRYSIQRVFPMSAPTIQAFWIPIVSTEWVMKEAEPHRDTNTVISAGTNGILHGRIYAAHDRQRGTLKIYVGRDADVATPTAQPYVAASVQLDQQSNRFVPRNSLMLPVAIGTRYQAVTQSPLEDLPVDLFWTPLVPA